MLQTPKELAEKHYSDLKERPFFPDLVNYIISGPVVCMVSVVWACTNHLECLVDVQEHK
jgi:nucleoside diphosphate kinase